MIKTTKRRCLTYTGVDVIKAREKKDWSQGNLAKRCSFNVAKIHNYEMLTNYIVIPKGYKPIEEANFELLQRALS